MGNNRKYKLVGLILVIAVLAFCYWGINELDPHFYDHTVKLAFAGDVEGLSEYISTFGYMGFFVSILLLVICNLFGIPTIPFLTVNGVLFGLIPGLICSYIGEVIGVELSFHICRIFFRKDARKFVEKKHMLSKLDRYGSVKNLAILRAIPYGPNILATALAVLSPLTPKQHLKATLIGKIPSVFVEVTMGHDLIYFRQNGVRFVIFLAILIVLYLVYRHHKKTHSSLQVKQ